MSERVSEPTGFRGILAEPLFFRGERSTPDTDNGWDAINCDRLIAETDSACDEPSEYLIEWQWQHYDGSSIPISGCCERHALDVDRQQVVRMSTHPRKAYR